ncbi:MAG TPA: bifunctional (p)ppGpp synthetase/guanosine-3',5'-bis(diphosphate) 3'-pyrophosphohydrolase [Rhodospirillales bacterium]|jgi:hypothetical protein|nr:bifunctional (p)ppGpp synthetase/guanosine-3',5'-bis(diphosphate) 3'-pyrophosphohydrolase [Rhodospirillales bacterium]
MNNWNQDKYIKAWNYASRVHNESGQNEELQLVPGTDIPYINHIGLVAMETMDAVAHGEEINNPDLLVQCALLHDTIEDTKATYDDIKNEFGIEVAEGVSALSKDENIKEKAAQMEDSLKKIRKQPKEIWMVKLSDRITNLQPPPKHWNQEKIKKYKNEAELILEELGEANQYLADRLENKISNYEKYIYTEQSNNGGAQINWVSGGGIVLPVERTQLPPHNELPPEATTVHFDGVDAYHVTLIRKSVMLPHEQAMLRSEVWSWISDHAPQIPEPIFSGDIELKGGENGETQRWFTLLDNQDEYQKVVDKLVGVVERALYHESIANFIHKPLDHNFHVTLANDKGGDPLAGNNRLTTK